jgi:hypothetical protein
MSLGRLCNSVSAACLLLLSAPDQHLVLDAFYKYKNLCNCLDKTGKEKQNKTPPHTEKKKKKKKRTSKEGQVKIT